MSEGRLISNIPRFNFIIPFEEEDLRYLPTS